jgi:hypothetical protein
LRKKALERFVRGAFEHLINSLAEFIFYRNLPAPLHCGLLLVPIGKEKLFSLKDPVKFQTAGGYPHFIELTALKQSKQRILHIRITLFCR